jgi:hypothetical protein
MPEDFAHCGFKDGLDIRTTDAPKPAWLHIDVEPVRRPVFFSGLDQFPYSKAQERYERYSGR